MTLASLVNVSAGLALIILVGFTMLAGIARSRLELYAGTLPLPSGPERWNPARYRPGAERWLRLDRYLFPYGTRVWVALLAVNVVLAVWSRLL
jgi:hypothetical protein